MATFSDYLLTSALTGKSGFYVRLLNNSSGTSYISDTVTDVNGKFTFSPTSPPPGSYTVFYGLAATVPGTATATGDANYLVPVSAGDDAALKSLTVLASSPYTSTAPAGFVAAGILDNGGAVFNVKHPKYGAKGDGSTADDAAIQLAINDAGVAGGIVFLPQGNYRIIAGLTISATQKSVWIAGAGMSNVSSSGTVIRKDTVVNGAFTALTVNGSPFRMSDITFDVFTFTRNLGDGVQINPAGNGNFNWCVLSNVQVANNAGKQLRMFAVNISGLTNVYCNYGTGSNNNDHVVVLEGCTDLFIDGLDAGGAQGGLTHHGLYITNPFTAGIFATNVKLFGNSGDGLRIDGPTGATAGTICFTNISAGGTSGTDLNAGWGITINGATVHDVIIAGGFSSGNTSGQVQKIGGTTKARIFNLEGYSPKYDTPEMTVDVNGNLALPIANGYIQLTGGGNKFLRVATNGFEIQNSAFTQALLRLLDAGSLLLFGTITSYNNIATQGMGVPAIYQAPAPTIGATAAVASVATIASPNDGAKHTYDVRGFVRITTLGSGTINLQVTYTDTNGTVQTCTIPLCAQAGAFVASATTADDYKGGLEITVNPNTAVTIKTAGTFTGCTYNTGGNIKQVL